MTLMGLTRILGAAGITLSMAAPASAAPVELWARFNVAPSGTVASISIPLTGGTFGVGGVGGPAASAALLSQVLSTLTEVRIAGLGNGAGLDFVTQAFGFGLSNVQFGSGPGETFANIANFPFGFAPFGAPSQNLGASGTGGSPGGRLEVFSFDTTPNTLVGFTLSSAFTGDQSARAGEALTFRWLALESISNLTPGYVADGGRVILLGDDGVTSVPGEVPVPGPGSLALFGVGLFALAARPRRAAR
jgi:hypothetical protein